MLFRSGIIKLLFDIKFKDDNEYSVNYNDNNPNVENSAEALNGRYIKIYIQEDGRDKYLYGDGIFTDNHEGDDFKIIKYYPGLYHILNMRTNKFAAYKNARITFTAIHTGTPGVHIKHEISPFKIYYNDTNSEIKILPVIELDSNRTWPYFCTACNDQIICTNDTNNLSTFKISISGTYPVYLRYPPINDARSSSWSNYNLPWETSDASKENLDCVIDDQCIPIQGEDTKCRVNHCLTRTKAEEYCQSGGKGYNEFYNTCDYPCYAELYSDRDYSGNYCKIENRSGNTSSTCSFGTIKSYRIKQNEHMVESSGDDLQCSLTFEKTTDCPSWTTLNSGQCLDRAGNPITSWECSGPRVEYDCSTDNDCRSISS